MQSVISSIILFVGLFLATASLGAQTVMDEILSVNPDIDETVTQAMLPSWVGPMPPTTEVVVIDPSGNILTLNGAAAQKVILAFGVGEIRYGFIAVGEVVIGRLTVE